MQRFLSQIIKFPIDSIERVSSLGNTNMAARWLHCMTFQSFYIDQWMRCTCCLKISHF